MSTNVVFQSLAPCIDMSGHKFIVSRPNPGDYGHALVVCERCGKLRTELER